MLSVGVLLSVAMVVICKKITDFNTFRFFSPIMFCKEMLHLSPNYKPQIILYELCAEKGY
jgi:hypothetical protein